MARTKKEKGTAPSSTIPMVHSPLEYYPEHVRLVGMISIEMANMDYTLASLLGSLLHIDEEIGRTLYLTPRVAIGKLEMLGNTITASVRAGSERDKQLRDLLAKARSIIQKRHEMIHDFWGVDEETGHPSRISLPTRPTKPKRLAPINELEDMVTQIRTIMTTADFLARTFYAEWPPYASLDKSGLPKQSAIAAKTRPRRVHRSKQKPPPRSSPA